jgi:type III restriction enzyme
MQLKQYQQETLDTLRRFLQLARVAGPANAYAEITEAPEQARRLGRYRGAYRALDGLPDRPYVCLRLPTGGGKTILGACSIPLARDSWIEKDYPIVLWLVPTNTIRQQTADALKNSRHPYRQVLDDAFDGRVRIFDIADFPNIRPHDIRDNLVIVVGTLQTLRVDKTEGRKVYAHHEELEPHFSGVDPRQDGLEKLEDGPREGTIKFSFANLLHLHQPLMIVDEAHNAVTGLTRDMQARVNPSAIIEFTATPRTQSNILHSVSAMELKREEMIKLPIVLAEHPSWQAAVSGAILTRATLAKAAETDHDYLRPLVLFQAQNRDREVTVDILKKHLIETESISESKIAVVTGDQRELDSINLFDRTCPIEFVITVEALKEGWDCSFAYVFCSVARIADAGDVEQLLGRVLRMPYARRREVPALNKAYAHVSEPSFGEAARALTDRLVHMGFDEDETQDVIEPAQISLEDGGLFGPRAKPLPVFRHKIEVAPEIIAELKTRAISGVAIEHADGGIAEIVVTGAVSPQVEQALVEALPPPQRSQLSEAVASYRYEMRHVLSPAERGVTFKVPALAVNLQGRLELVDHEILMENHEWSLTDHSAQLSPQEFDVRESANLFEIDIDGNHVTYRFERPDDQLKLDIDVQGWTVDNLAVWLDRQLRQSDIAQGVMLRWIRDCLTYLVKNRGLHISALMRAKFQLAKKLKAKIDEIKKFEQNQVYQTTLFKPDAQILVSFDCAFEFQDGMYDGVKRHRYDGRFRFSKHFLGDDRVPAFDGVDGGEEFKCAQAVDSLPPVVYWLRNVARHPRSFRLPLASGSFYPDFVARLDDGRTLVVEYKGALLAGSGNDDTNEKRLVGELWERKSNGQGLFIVVERELDGMDMRAQLMRKLGH